MIWISINKCLIKTTNLKRFVAFFQAGAIGYDLEIG